MIIINCLTAANLQIILNFINRVIQNCAIMGRAPINIHNIFSNGKEYFIQIEYFEDVKKDIEPFIKMLNDETNKFYKELKK